MDYIALGKNIAVARKARKLTQEQLAENIDVSTVFISQIETAVRKPSLETMYKLSQALGTSIDSLIDSNNNVALVNDIAKLLNEKTKGEINLILRIVHDVCDYIKY